MPQPIRYFANFRKPRTPGNTGGDAITPDFIKVYGDAVAGKLVRYAIRFVIWGMKESQPLSLTVCRISMRFDAANLSKGLELLVSGSGPVRAKAGCVSCQVGTDVSDAGVVIYSEEWNSKTAFQHHLQSEEFFRVLVALDMCSEEPRVVVGDLTGSEGIACLAALRRKGRREPNVPPGAHPKGSHPE